MTQNFITPNDTGVTIDNVSYDLRPGSTMPVASTDAFIELSSIAYVPGLHTANYTFYRKLATLVPLSNSTTTNSTVTNSTTNTTVQPTVTVTVAPTTVTTTAPRPSTGGDHHRAPLVVVGVVAVVMIVMAVLLVRGRGRRGAARRK